MLTPRVSLLDASAPEKEQRQAISEARGSLIAVTDRRDPELVERLVAAYDAHPEAMVAFTDPDLPGGLHWPFLEPEMLAVRYSRGAVMSGDIAIALPGRSQLFDRWLPYVLVRDGYGVVCVPEVR